MKLNSLAATLAFSLLAAPALAAPLCTSTTPLGTLDAEGNVKFEASYGAAGNHVDCFTFSPSEAVDGAGHINDFDTPNNQLDIELTQIELYLGTEKIATIPSPKNFDFGDLVAGAEYTLALYSQVSSVSGRFDTSVAYKGQVEAAATQQQVPEPGVLALTGLALVAVVVAARRRGRSGSAPVGAA